MQAELSSFTLADKVYPLREALPLNIEEEKNLCGMYVLHNQDYLILSMGYTIEEAIKDAATQLAKTYHIYVSAPELSSHAIIFRNKLESLIDA